MIQAKIISGGTSYERANLAHDLIYKLLNLVKDTPSWEKISTHPDFLLFSPKTSLGIEEIREIEHQIGLKPYSYPLKIILIENADLLTIQAQNAFLKTLEEPPSYCLIILSVGKKSSLLETVRSRCQIITLPAKSDVDLNHEEEENLVEALDSVLNGDVGYKFQWAEIWGKDKEVAEESLAKLSLVGQNLLVSSHLEEKVQSQTLKAISKVKLIKFLHQVIVFRKYLEANINPRFTLENLFLSC